MPQIEKSATVLALNPKHSSFMSEISQINESQNRLIAGLAPRVTSLAKVNKLLVT